jgi:Transglycosylase SLT domain
VLVFLLAIGGSLSVLALVGREDEPPDQDVVRVDPDEPDPFAYEENREREFVARATAGHSHVLYEKSPGGVFATARRVERWRDRIEEQATIEGADPDLLEAMVFLESAGYPDARASDDLEGAVGLTQILAETATGFLGMRVDVEESERLTRRIARAEQRGDTARAKRLRARREEVDERFNPDWALQGAGQYLAIAEDRFGSEELAVVSYHMGIGNLENVLDAYGEDDVSWAQVYFGATPSDHPETYELLSGFGDDSATYLWRVYAAREIMRLYREDQAELRRLARLQTAKVSAEEVLHPPSATEVYETPEELDEAYLSGDLRPFADVEGMQLDPDVGELAGRIDAERRLYRGLRPEALELAVYLSAGVRDVAGTRASLVVTSTVRDVEYQRVLARRNDFATEGYSLHTTGYAFDVRRDYASRDQAVAFEYMLDRLQSLSLIAWIREPGAIHITASSEADELIQ